MPTRTQNVAAAELPAYINSLPRLLTEQLIFNVTGELDEPLRLNGFYGSGIITIQGSGNFSIRNYTVVTNCSIPIYLTGVEFSDSGALSTKYLLEVYRSSAPVYLSKCIFTGINKTTVMTGVESYYGACISCINCSFTNLDAAVLAGDNCLITVETEEGGGSVYSDNNHGAYVARGGIIMLSGNTPKTLGGTTNGRYRGGAIINSDGTLQ